MARDLPDWHALTAQSRVHEVTDLGELAVRLGSIVSFDRRGDVMWLDNFEDGLLRWYATTPGDSTAELSTDVARSCISSAKLQAATGTASYSQLLAAIPNPLTLERVGFEYSFSLHGAVGKVRLAFAVYTGTHIISGAITWDDANERLEYMDSTGAEVTLQDAVKMYAWNILFNSWKLVMDADAFEYVRLLLNGVEYDMSGIAARVTESVLDPHMRVTIQVDGRTAGTSTIYADDSIITQNEPPNP